MRFPVRRAWIALGAPALVAGVAIAGASGAFELGLSSNGDAQADASAAPVPRRTAATTATTTTTSTTTTAPPTTTTEPPPPPTAAPPTTRAPAAPVPTVAAAVVVQPAASPGGVIGAANAQRSSAGLAPLQGHGGLAACAQAVANQIAASRSLTHSNLACPLGVGGGVTRVGEILFSGTANFSDAFIVQYWMGSPTHRVHLMDPGYRFAGVGVAVGSDGSIWVAMHFGA